MAVVDRDIWDMYAKGVKKLGQKVEELPTPAPKKKPVPPQETPLFEEALKAEPPQEQPQPIVTKSAQKLPTPKPWKIEPLDLRVERNMSLGDVVIEAKLDLHGKTEAEAHEAFKIFIETQAQRGKRMLLVITGRGQDGVSVLRNNLPRWCEVTPFDDAILAVRTAAQHHGGDGAYYVLLRKAR